MSTIMVLVDAFTHPLLTLYLALPLSPPQAKGPTAYANNATFVAEYTCGLLATSFPNMTPTQIQAAVAGMMAIEDKRAFKHHMRDFLVQVGACGCMFSGLRWGQGEGVGGRDGQGRVPMTT
jgi:hypothetical protein